MSGSSLASEIHELGFRVAHRSRRIDLVAPGFEVDPDDWAAHSPTGLSLTRSAPPAPYVSVVVTVGSPSRSAAAGVSTEGGDHVVVRWSPTHSHLIIEARQRGRARVLRRKKFSPDGAFDLAFALCENQVTLLVDSGQGWRPMLTERSRIRQNVDFRQPDVLHQYRYAWEGDSSGVIGVQAGLFGQMGLRDPHLVEHSDGRPFTQDGRHFLSWTCAGLGFFPQAHWSVWSFDPATPEEMRLESKLFFARDGLILGDHAGHVVRDGDRWHIAVSAWGDFPEGPIHVRHLSTDADVLSGVHLLPTAPTPLPTQFGAWDPGLLRCGDRWHVSFVESESQTPFVFRPALASTTNEDWTCALEAVPLHGEFRQCEGPIFSRVADRTWLLASDGEARQYPVFSLDGRRAGRLQAPYLTNIPHPQLVADPRGGWWLVTFDGTQFAENVLGYGGHGDLVVMHTV